MKLIINSEIALQSVEEWRDVPGLEGKYQASSLGRIRSLDRLVPTCYGAKRTVRGRVLSSRPGASGYVRIPPKVFGTQFVHRLVAMAFIPNPHGLPVINHIDGNKANNRVENLEWCTQADNLRHAHRTGLARGMDLKKGDLSIASKLTSAQVSVIKRCLKEGHRSIDIAREFGVVKGTIAEIKAGRSWGHIQ